MKAILLVGLASAVKYKPLSFPEMMDEVLENTMFSREHNTSKDRQFLTSVFQKYTELGEDSQGNVNGKRVLTPWTAKYAAIEILSEWKGMKSADLDEFVESD